MSRKQLALFEPTLVVQALKEAAKLANSTVIHSQPLMAALNSALPGIAPLAIAMLIQVVSRLPIQTISYW